MESKARLGADTIGITSIGVTTGNVVTVTIVPTATFDELEIWGAMGATGATGGREDLIS